MRNYLRNTRGRLSILTRGGEELIGRGERRKERGRRRKKEREMWHTGAAA